MKQKRFFSLLAAALLFLAFAACNKNKDEATPPDEEAPKIIMTHPEVLPRGEFNYLLSQDTFNIDIRFEDNRALKEYEIQVRYDESQLFPRTNHVPYEPLFVGKLEGESDAINRWEWITFDPTAGPYTFTVTVWDEAGNSSSQTTYLYIMNQIDTLRPVVNLSAPDTNNVDTFVIGSNIVVQGNVTDNIGVKDVFLRVKSFSDELLAGSEIYIDTVNTGFYPLDTFVYVPAGTTPGDYNLEVFGLDGVNNVGKRTVPIYIRTN